MGDEDDDDDDPSHPLFPLTSTARYHVPARTLIIRPFVPGRRVNRGNDVTNDFEFKRARFSENGGKVHVPERRLVSVSKSDRLGRGVVMTGTKAGFEADSLPAFRKPPKDKKTWKAAYLALKPEEGPTPMELEERRLKQERIEAKAEMVDGE